MKQIELTPWPFLTLAFFFMTSVVMGQDVFKSPTAKFLHKRGYAFPGDKKSTNKFVRWPDTLYYNTMYRAKLLGSPTIPFSFSRLEFTHGKYNISPTISAGYGYTWFYGNFLFGENDKIIVFPTIFFGFVAEIGLQNDNAVNGGSFTLSKPKFLLGGFIGTTGFSLFTGYDFVIKSPTIGLGSRIDVFTLSQKSLRPIGRVRELRRHKRIARPIDDE